MEAGFCVCIVCVHTPSPGTMTGLGMVSQDPIAGGAGKPKPQGWSEMPQRWQRPHNSHSFIEVLEAKQMELAARNQENATFHHGPMVCREVYQPLHQKAVEGNGD